MTVKAILLAGFLLVGCSESLGGAAEYSEMFRASQSELKGGIDENGATAVVPIYRQGTFVCTGTLVAPRIVVTAAHCITTREAPLGISDRGSASQGAISVIDFDVHPRYRREGLDVAVLALEKPAGSAALPISADAPMVTIESGLPVQIAGFGRTVVGEEPTERKGSALVVDANEDTLLLEGDGCAPCFGDSGGPVLAGADDSLRLLAVISNGDAECSGRQFNAVRLDTQTESFLAPHIARLQTTNAQAGARCLDNQSCESGICSDHGTGLKTCAFSCADGQPCPSGEECVQEADARTCRPRTIFGALGSLCEDDGECRSGICVERNGKRICATACSPGSDPRCPDTFDCISNDTEPEPFLCEPTVASVASAGCAIAQPSHTAPRDPASTVLMAAIAAILGTLRRRR